MAKKEYIERRKAIKALIGWDTDPTDEDIKYVLNEITAADVVDVRHGEWVEGAEHFTNGFYEAECSECGNYIRWNEGNSGDWNYCPNCGAKMDGGKHE